MTVYYREFPTPIADLGALRIAATGDALIHCDFIDSPAAPVPAGWQWSDDNAVLTACQKAIEAYFNGGELKCSFPLAPQGSDFQRQVWDALREIPAGQTRSYGDVARRIGRPTAVRAVAGAIGRNPIGILIPCHRVIGSDGSLTGYAGGLHRKSALLSLEKTT